MNSDIKFVLDSETVETLNAYSELLQKDTTTILKEALQQYFENEEKRVLEKRSAEHDAMTNLDFNEFWDDVEI